MCPYCGSDGEICAFGGYLHYIAVKHSIDSNVRGGYIKMTGEGGGVTSYECENCGEKWIFMPPEFPRAGFYKREN